MRSGESLYFSLLLDNCVLRSFDEGFHTYFELVIVKSGKIYTRVDFDTLCYKKLKMLEFYYFLTYPHLTLFRHHPLSTSRYASSNTISDEGASKLGESIA
jgi:hypothetical protein